MAPGSPSPVADSAACWAPQPAPAHWPRPGHRPTPTRRPSINPPTAAGRPASPICCSSSLTTSGGPTSRRTARPTSAPRTSTSSRSPASGSPRPTQPSAVCSPTRFSLYTGRYPGRRRAAPPNRSALHTRSTASLLDHPTLATLLGTRLRHRDVRQVALRLPALVQPHPLGWDEFFGNFSGGLDYFSKINHNGDHDLFEDEVEVEDLRYYTEILTEQAVGFIHRKHARPGRST